MQILKSTLPKREVDIEVEVSYRTTGLLAMARQGWPMVWAWSDQWPKPYGQPWLAMGFGPGSFIGQRACHRLPKAGHGQPWPALRQVMQGWPWLAKANQLGLGSAGPGQGPEPWLCENENTQARMAVKKSFF